VITNLSKELNLIKGQYGEEILIEFYKEINSLTLNDNIQVV